MERQDNDYYDRYEGYDRDDAHYHSARNLTNEFEEEFQRDRGHYDHDRNSMPRSYHEGDMGDAYERMSRQGRSNHESGNRWSNHDSNRSIGSNTGFSRDQDRYNTGSSFNSFDRDRSSDRYNNSSNRNRYGSSDSSWGSDHNNQDRLHNNWGHDRSSNRHDRDTSWRSRLSEHDRHGSSSQGYAGYGSNSGRLHTDSANKRSQSAGMQNRFSGYGDRDRHEHSGYGSSRYNNDRDDSFTDTYRGNLSSGFGTRDFDNDSDSGRSRSYRDQDHNSYSGNGGRSSGYSDDQRRNTYGSRSSGTTSGNFSGFGLTGGSPFDRDRGNITGDNAYNSDRRY